MESGWGLVLVCIVCVLGHIVTAWYFSYLVRSESSTIDDKIHQIDQGLGMIAMRLMDPEHWQSILSQVAPQSDPISMILEFLKANREDSTPRVGYSRSIDGRFNAAPEWNEEERAEEVHTESIERD